MVQADAASHCVFMMRDHNEVKEEDTWTGDKSVCMWVLLEVGGHYSAACRQFSEQGSGTQENPVHNTQLHIYAHFDLWGTQACIRRVFVVLMHRRRRKEQRRSAVIFWAYFHLHFLIPAAGKSTGREDSGLLYRCSPLFSKLASWNLDQIFSCKTNLRQLYLIQLFKNNHSSFQSCHTTEKAVFIDLPLDLL